MKYKVVRSFDYGCEDLQNLFDDGWKFLRASEYIPPEVTHNGGIRRYGYIEYILFKNEENKKEETKYDMGRREA